MSLQAFVWAVRSLTFLAAVSLGLLVTLLDPEVVGVYAAVLFLLLVTFVVWGVLYLLLLGGYRLILGDQRTVERLGGIFRQTLFIALGLMLSVLLHKWHLLYWWSLALVVAMVFLLEFTFYRAPKPIPEEDRTV
jgi:predicted permease